METLDRGRSSFDRHVWGDAYAQLSAADGEEPLGPEDLQRLAVAAYLVGEDDVPAEAWERAHLAAHPMSDTTPSRYRAATVASAPVVLLAAVVWALGRRPGQRRAPLRHRNGRVRGGDRVQSGVLSPRSAWLVAAALTVCGGPTAPPRRRPRP